ncbi:MAG: hemerythrin domain-containing protein [Deltaproteobacteria bacterium]|nr:hemerythrin domain-containing protein [Deltaproteobacteria bacterium]
MGILRKLFGKDTTTDVLELLTAQHKEVDELIAKLEHGSGPRRGLLVQLADRLAAHATVEEKLFYPAIMAKKTEDQLHEAVEEHLSIKRLLADMIEMRLDDDSFDAKLAVLKEQVRHHAHQEEEGELFPEVKDMLSADERAALGNEVLVMFEELMQGHPSQQVPKQTAQAAKLPSLR